jgi:hypothetical protein
MSALVCEEPIATDACPRCGDLAEVVQTLREEVGPLCREVATLRAEAGDWKSRHADAVKRNEQVRTELPPARGEIRPLQDKLFGRRSERRLAGQDLAKLVEDEGRHHGSEAGSRATAGAHVWTAHICRRRKKSARCLSKRDGVSGVASPGWE